jgi:hypothetical protein
MREQEAAAEQELTLAKFAKKFGASTVLEHEISRDEPFKVSRRTSMQCIMLRTGISTRAAEESV